MQTKFLDGQLEQIKDKVLSGDRLNFDDGLCLYKSQDLIAIGRLANYVKQKKYSDKVYYVYNQHLNYTNICINRCFFCAFSRDKQESGAYTYSIEDIKQRLLERIDEPIQELHIVGGLNPALSFQYYLDMLQEVKKLRPDATIKAFTSAEIDYLSQIASLSIEDTIDKLKQVGLQMMPGGGAEVMSDRVRAKLFPKKIGKQRWLEIMEKAHNAGLTSNATMLYGHIETLKERVNHLIALRDLQDKTKGFSAFIPLAFHSKNTKLDYIPSTTAYDDLKNIAIARLMLDNFDHIKAYWVMIGEKLAQVALSFGADDLDGTIIDEKITHMAGAKSAKGLTRNQMEHLVLSAGLQPVERDSFYNPVQKVKE